MTEDMANMGEKFTLLDEETKEFIRVPMIRAWKIIEFEYVWDKFRVMEGRPWLFDGNLFSLLEFDGFTPPSQFDFEKAAF
jgi:hypothetical protein